MYTELESRIYLSDKHLRCGEVSFHWVYRNGRYVVDKAKPDIDDCYDAYHKGELRPNWTEEDRQRYWKHDQKLADERVKILNAK